MRDSQSKWTLTLLALSLVCVTLAGLWPRTRQLEPLVVWQAGQEQLMQQRYEEIQQRVSGLETIARELGDAAYLLVADSIQVATIGSEEQIALLNALRDLQVSMQLELPERLQAAIGVQIFASDGQLIAWAGSASLETTTRRITRFQRGERQIYFRQGGVHTFLTYDRQDERGAPEDPDAESVSRPRVVVDLPVQASSRLPRRYLQTWSLADDFATGGIDVQLYFDSRNLPSYLVSQDIEFSGDEQRGLQAEFVVRGSDGSPRFAGRMTKAPYADDVTQLQGGARRVRNAWSVVALVFLLWAGVLLVRRYSPAHATWGMSLYVVGGLWALRLLLVWLDIPAVNVGGHALVDPQGFGMTQGAGICRTPLDFLMTSFVCLVTAAVVFGLVQSRFRERPSTNTNPFIALLGSLTAGATVCFAVAASYYGLMAVAENTSIPLMGSSLDPGSLVTVSVQIGMLVTVASVLAVAMLLTALLSTSRLGVLLIAVALLLLVPLRLSWTVGAVTLAVWFAGNWLRTLLQDQRFTSFGLAVFALVAVVATLSTEAIHRQTFEQQQQQVVERADHLRQLVDEVRPFVLERMLKDLREDPSVLTGSPRQRDVERNALAFQLWAGSILSHLGWSCQVRVYDAFGVQASEFSVDMPYGRDTPSRELLERVRADGLRVEQSEVEATTAGRVRVYRGAVPVEVGGRVQALVVVDLPFAREDLTQVVNAGASPRWLQPRGGRTENQADLFAWVEDGVVVESSTPYLEVGSRLPPPTDSGAWQTLDLVDGEYRVTQRGSGKRVLWAGFRTASPFDRLLEWSQVASLYFSLALAALLLMVGIARIPLVRRSLPMLLIPKRIGIQQKLMGAFLVVALLPSLVLSWATGDVTRDRNIERNRDAALEKARSAEAALADLVQRETDTVRESEYLREVLKQEDTPPVRDIGHLEFSQIMVFQGNGQLVLDETLSNLSDQEAREFVTGAPGRVFASRDGSGNLNLGALVPVWFSREEGLSEAAEDAALYYLYYRRRLTDGVLRDLAPILNTDISGFLGPELVVSSQKGLATAGLLPSLVPAVAFQQIQLRRNRYAVLEERTGEQHSFTGYLPLRDRFDERIGLLAVSQFLQQDEFAAESERTRAVVVGLSTLMFVLTLILGVVFASRIFDPVRSLIEGTQRLAGGEFGFRLQARAGDEIGQLERSFNEMAESVQTARLTVEERRRYLEAVLGNVASGVVATDSQGRITATNEAVSRILHRRGSSLEGRTCEELAAAAPDSGARTLWNRIGGGSDGEVFEVTLLRDGERLTLRVIATDLRPADNAAQSLGRVAIFEDVTDLIRSKKLAAWAEMARQVAHEIKNPLTPLKSEAQFMERAWRDGSDKFPQIFEEGMRTIIQQVDTLRTIASEFSNYGRVQKLDPQPMDLGSLLEGVVGPYANMDGLNVEVGNGSAPYPGTGIQVLGDAEGLRKVFRNVFENAREAMQGAGRIQLSVEAPKDGVVQIVVLDEGKGISKDAHERLFEPYFSTKSTGTGLGLAITRGILEELGGHISLSNRPQGGAEARVTLVVC